MRETTAQVSHAGEIGEERHMSQPARALLILAIILAGTIILAAALSAR